MTDLTPAERNLLAWHTLPCRYAPCAQAVGRRCVTASGARTSPHAVRLSDLDIWLSRQPEVDALNALVTSLRAANDQLTATLKASDDKLDKLAAQLEDSEGQVDHLGGAINTLEDEYATLLAEFDAYEKAHPDVPAPTPTRTIFGACILDKGASGVVAKFGQGAAIRKFLTPPSVATEPAGSLMHVSIKQLGTPDQVDAWLKTGGIRTFKHEPDNDDMTPAQIAAWKQTNNDLYDRNVALGRPCLIAPTFTGDFWSNHKTDAYRDTWLAGLKADLYGLDFDGVHDNQTTRPADLTYRVGKTEITNTDEIAALQRAMAKYGVSGYCVPEFGTSRATWDKDGTGRALWIQANAQRFIDSGAYYVAWYDHAANGKSDVVDPGSPELAALKALVASNPTT